MATAEEAAKAFMQGARIFHDWWSDAKVEFKIGRGEFVTAMRYSPVNMTVFLLNGWIIEWPKPDLKCSVCAKPIDLRAGFLCGDCLCRKPKPTTQRKPGEDEWWPWRLPPKPNGQGRMPV